MISGECENGLMKMILSFFTYCFLMLGLPGVQQINKVTFDQINFDGCLVPLSETEMIISYKELLYSIQRHFKYAQLCNGVIAFYLLFATNHWPLIEIDNLDELQRIKWINELGNDLITFGCQNKANKSGKLAIFNIDLGLDPNPMLASMDNNRNVYDPIHIHMLHRSKHKVRVKIRVNIENSQQNSA